MNNTTLTFNSSKPLAGTQGSSLTVVIALTYRLICKKAAFLHKNDAFLQGPFFYATYIYIYRVSIFMSKLQYIYIQITIYISRLQYIYIQIAIYVSKW